LSAITGCTLECGATLLCGVDAALYSSHLPARSLFQAKHALGCYCNSWFRGCVCAKATGDSRRFALEKVALASSLMHDLSRSSDSEGFLRATMSFHLWHCYKSSRYSADSVSAFAFLAARASATASFLRLVGPSTIVIFRPSCLGANSTKANSATSSTSRCNNL